MKLPRLITRQRLKWTGLISSGLLVAIVIGTMFVRYSYLWVGEGDDRIVCLVAVEDGGLLVAYEHPSDDRAIEYVVGDLTGFSTGFRTSWRWWFVVEGDPRNPFWLIVPLWVPLCLIAAPTAWLWYTDRRAKPWQCRKCRYDLRGLNGGVCPECGEASR